MDRLTQSVHGGRPVSTIDAAKANDVLEHFISAGTLKTILSSYRNMCELLHLKPNVFPLFYPKLKANLNSWKAKALWKKFDARASHKCYARGKVCPNTRVLIIGAGPCGLRTAIEAQLLGAKVVVIEKRDRMSRNNVLHLWPFVIEDLRALGAKKFFGKFCAGAIDHISIRQLQCILLKVALLLGVEVYTEVSFEQLVAPNSTEKIGWRAEFKPSEHPVSQYEFDVIIGADGKRNTLEGFKRKEFRGKLAIAITANFINKRTEAEARVEEISGVAFIFNQKFFKELNSETGIDLENIVYYKDDTHYFVMTAKKPSLIDKGVIKQDYADTARLLSPDNVDRVALMNYAREAADFSTNYLMPDLEFAVNHYGQPDVAMFDFTSMYAAENASRVIERHGYKLLMILVGDSLLEPFWPTGSGCARGFLSSLDACWAIKAWGSGSVTPLEVLAERESIYRLLAQTTPENLNKDCKAYTVDPSTRYPNLNKAALLPQQVLSLYDTDDPNRIELTPRVLQPVSVIEPHRKRRRRDMHLDPNTLINWIKEQIKEYEDLNVEDVTTSFKDGRVLCAILHHYRPDLLDYSIIKADDIAKNNELAFDLLEKEIGIPPVMTGDEMAKAEVPDYLTMFSYLTQIYDTFRGEIPHIKHPKLTNLHYPPEVPNLCPFSQLSGIIQNNYKQKLYPNRFYPLSWTPLKSQILRSRNSLGFNKRSVRPKALKLQMKCEKNTRRKDDNWRRMSYHLLNKNKSLNYSKCSILNFNPIKSIEQCKENSVDFLHELNKFKSENVNENLDLERINSVKQWVAVTAEYTLATSEVEEENVKCFDENFKEIKPNPTFNVTYSVEDSDVSREISRTTRNDGNENVTLNNNQLLDKDYSSPLNVKLPNYDENINNVTSVTSDIIIRCVEENNNFISLRVLKFCSSSNTFSITTPLISSKVPRLKQRDQVCLKSLIETVKNKKTIEDECSRISKVKQIISTVPTVNHFSSKQKDQVCTKSSTETKQKEKPIQSKCHFINFKHFKFLYSSNMSSDTDISLGLTYDRIVDWINLSDFKERDETSDMENDFTEKLSGITSVTKQLIQYDDYIREASNLLFEPKNKKIEDGTKEIMCHCHCHNKLFDGSATSIDSIGRLMDKLKSSDVLQFSKPGLWKHTLSKSSMSEPPLRFSAITETEEADLADIRENSSKEITNSSVSTKNIIAAMVSRSSNRPKRQAEPTVSLTKSTTSSERKNKKRRSFEKYDIGLDRENRLPSQMRGGGADEEFAARIKDLEDKWRDPIPVDKKPKDLTRSIGKIQTSDWNIREIEKKIIENKLGKSVNKEKERVPKWNREQFLARQTRLEKLDRQNSAEAKFSELDKGIKHLEQRLKEGSVRDLGQNKVATITEKLATKAVEPEVKLAPKTNSKPAVVLPTQSGSEYCHFCHKRVYLMERLSAEGRFFHRGCFKCQYCQITLRLGSYMFDRDGQYGHRFYCTQHFGMPGELYDNKEVEQKHKKESAKPLEKLKIISLSGVEGVDLLDRVQTPERIEFSNLSVGHISSDHDESLSQMDEDEWTDRNFGASTAEVCSSDEDEDSSSLSGSESDDEEAYEEALEEPPTKEGTMRWMERYKQRYSKEGKKDEDSDSEQYTSSSDHSSYYENSSGDEEDEPATEGEEDIRARELRKQEVRVEPPVVHTDTGSDTEIVSDESSPESLSKHNSATEISTDSEFAVDDPTPTREIPSIIFNDFNVTKTRGGIGLPKKVQVKSGILQLPVNGKTQKQMEFTPLVPSPVLPKPSTTLLARTEGYALNRTQSTGGIATKVSLELKKKYLLGDSGVPGSIQKSGSVSTLDSKFKSFHSNISDCQKLLKPSTEISPGMQSFCNKLNECRSPLSPIISQASPLKSPDIVSPTDKRIAVVNNSSHSPEQPDITKCTIEQTSAKAAVFEHELECRPRSPVKEIPIIVPKIDWSTTPKIKDSDISSDSLTSDSDSYEDQLGIKKSPTVKIFNNIPKVEIHDDAGDEIAFDSLCAETVLNQAENIIENPIFNDVPKSIVSEKKQLNQPKTLPGLQEDHVHELHTKQTPATTSGQTTPSEHDSFIEHTTAALTETELSDWAHDSAVSDDFEDVEFELNPSFVSSRKNKQPKVIQIDNQIIRNSIEELNEIEHVCGKDKQIKDLNNLLNSIEFMDTGEETSSDEKILIEATMKNNGYVEFQNEDDVIEDSLNPNINNIVETVNPAIKKCLILENLSSYEKNTGYCIIGNETLDNEKNNLKETEVETLKEKREQIENEEDSLLIVESGTTTEEKTCSDSTIKNMIEKVSDKEKKDIFNATSLINENKTLLNKIKNEQDIIVNKEENSDSYAFEEHCKRLQSKVEFGNIRDSIDIRKSKRKDKIEIPPKPDLIQEEVLNSIAITPTATTTSFTPKSLYTKEEIQKARNENQRLVQEMVMNKMKAENKSLERKKRNRNSFSPIRPSNELNKSEELETRNSMYSGESSVYSTPDVLLTTQDAPKLQQIPLEKSRTTTAINELNTSTPISLLKHHPKSFNKQLSIHQTSFTKSKFSSLPDTPLTNPEAFSLPDIQQALLKDDLKFSMNSTERLKYEARLKAQSKSNKDLGMSPEDKFKKLREKILRKGKENENLDLHIQDSIESLVINREKRNSLLYSNDTLTKRRNNSFRRSKSGEETLNQPVRTKSVSEISKSFGDAKLATINFNSLDEGKQAKLQFCKSDPNLLAEVYVKAERKIKSKDHDGRKSITKLISDFFGKKKDGLKSIGASGQQSKSFLSRISPKSKSKDKTVEEAMHRTHSFTEKTVHRNSENASPPPIPPLPLNYTGSGHSKCTDESSDGELGQQEHSSCETLDQSGIHGSRRSGKNARRASRQAKLKRHRMAQEIQRKLEETEVKTRELEQRGVTVEKALRGEAGAIEAVKEESELLKEWFDLMRDLTELRRYERELMVQAQELELEDSHARLQQELRERLENEDHKTKEDAKVESKIINEMMEIVAKRDSLIALLEQDRLRYSEEDHDFEEQMLAKGLRLTPLKRTSNK